MVSDTDVSESIPTSDVRGKAHWARLLLWTPLLFGGVVAAMLATRAVRLRRAVRKIIAQPPGSAETRQYLQKAIVGNDKATIAAVFGPPRAAMRRGAGARAVGGHGAARQFLETDTWYYPYHRGDRTAIVIEFDGGVARRAAFIQSPVPEENR